MKRFISTLMAFFLSVCMLVPIAVYADDVNGPPEPPKNFGALSTDDKLIELWNKVCNGIEFHIKYTEGGTVTQEDLDRMKSELQNEMTAKSEAGVHNFFNSQNTQSSNPDDAKESANQTISTIGTVNANIWMIISAAFLGEDYPELGLSFDLDSYIDDTSHVGLGSGGVSLFNVFRVIGYSLVLVFFSANLIETTIKYEIFTLRGAVSVFGRLLIAKIIIDMSGKICIAIANICTEICGKILGTTLTELQFSVPQIDLVTSDIWLVGPIIDYIVAMLIQGPLGLIMLTIVITSILILIKLLLRSFEMAMLVTVSPAFFACFSSDVTKQYFKNFIVTFIQVSAQIIFMAVVYYIGTSQITGFGYAPDEPIQTFAEVGQWCIKVIPNTIVMVAMAIMMIKPPRVLTNLIR